jgi:hypothetical protein
MSEPCQFETSDDKRVEKRPLPGRPPSAIPQAQNEIRRNSEIDIKRRTVAHLRATIVKFEREAANLGESISSELALASIQEPTPLAYPSSVRTMLARRDNLNASIAALSDRLAKFDSTVELANYDEFPNGISTL